MLNNGERKLFLKLSPLQASEQLLSSGTPLVQGPGLAYKFEASQLAIHDIDNFKFNASGGLLN